MPRHFLHLTDYSKDELWELLNLAKELKIKFRNKENFKPFKDRSLAMIFAKPSARTRVSFETGFEWMGGHALFLGPNDIGIGKREAVKDISRLFSRYNDIIMARLFDHKHILELAKYSSSADIGLSVIQPISKSYKNALPNKLFEYSVSGLPFICSNLSAMQDAVNHLKSGIAIQHNNHDEFINAYKKINSHYNDYVLDEDKRTSLLWEQNNNLSDIINE